MGPCSQGSKAAVVGGRNVVLYFEPFHKASESPQASLSCSSPVAVTVAPSTASSDGFDAPMAGRADVKQLTREQWKQHQRQHHAPSTVISYAEKQAPVDANKEISKAVVTSVRRIACQFASLLRNLQLHCDNITAALDLAWPLVLQRVNVASSENTMAFLVARLVVTGSLALARVGEAITHFSPTARTDGSLVVVSWRVSHYKTRKGQQAYG